MKALQIFKVIEMPEEKDKIKIIPLISDMDRKLGTPKSEVPISTSHIPTRDEMRKKALDDMMKRINGRSTSNLKDV